MKNFFSSFPTAVAYSPPTALPKRYLLVTNLMSGVTAVALAAAFMLVPTGGADTKPHILFILVRP